MTLTSYFRERAEVRRFNALKPEDRSIVFYAEDAASWGHYEPIIRELTGPMGRSICYLTSSATDPILLGDHERTSAFYIGAGTARTLLFLSLRAEVMVMTMPDLGGYYLKRSMVHAVHYVYVFHSMVSTHMIYRKGAFDYFDTVLCPGPHQVREIRAREAACGLPAKNLVEHGYGRLDGLLKQGNRASVSRNARSDGKRHLLVAPSWGPHGLLETLGVPLAGVLLRSGFHVTIRPHPMTTKESPQSVEALRRHFNAEPAFALDTAVSSTESFAAADLMITDWSGAAMEYAFAFERPVLFVDVPRKVNNPDYRAIECEPLEAAIRGEIGEVIAPEELDEIPKRIETLWADRGVVRERIRQARDRTVYNLGTSGSVGAAEIARLANEAMDCREQPRGAVAFASPADA